MASGDDGAYQYDSSQALPGRSRPVDDPIFYKKHSPTLSEFGSTLCFQTLVSILLRTIPLMGQDIPTLRYYTCIVSA